MARARNHGQSLDGAPLDTGTSLATTAAIAVSVLSFFGLSRTNVVLALTVATAAIVLGLVAHFRIPAAWAERNQRHRTWVDSQPAIDLSAFREALAQRQELLDDARHHWVRPLCATLSLVAAAVFVSYEMIGALGPDPIVGPLTAIWMTVSLGSALTFAGVTVFAAIGQAEEVDSVLH